MTDNSADLINKLLTQAGYPPISPYDKADVQLERHGKKIVLPADPAPMEIKDGIKALQRLQKDEEQEFDLMEFIEGHPHDAAVAFYKAMRALYGWASPVPTPGFFGPTNPDMISVRTGPLNDDVTQVPIGSFQIPNVQNPIFAGFKRGPKGRVYFVVQATAKRVQRGFLLELVKKAREILKEESIYRGRAVSAKANGEELQQELTFFDLRGVKKEEVILNDRVARQVQVNLWTPVEKTLMCEKHKIPLKRGILLEGKYGTGKSLTARVTAKVCEDNGWTFLHLDNVEALAAALTFAEQYAPCVVFAEDIDRVLSERDDKANQLVNTLDGVLSKNAKVITVLTTNHVEKIQPVMLRPGRLDAVISLETPDAETVKRLIHVYGAGLVSKDADLDPVARLLAGAGQIPATIREVVERSKLAMIAEGEKEVSGEALLVTAESMTAHLKLLNEPKNEPTDAEKLYTAFSSMIAKAAGGDYDGDVSHEDIVSNTDTEANITREVVVEQATKSQKTAAVRFKAIEDSIKALTANVNVIGEKVDEIAENVA